MIEMPQVGDETLRRIMDRRAKEDPGHVLLKFQDRDHTFGEIDAQVNRVANALLARGLKPGDRVLIAEACAHHPQADDIGRVKIPRWLRQHVGGELEIDVHSGKDFPDDLSPYALIVQCGGCTVTRKHILARQYRAARQGVPMTNYGMAISVSQGVIERALECFPAALDAYRRGMAGA